MLACRDAHRVRDGKNESFASAPNKKARRGHKVRKDDRELRIERDEPVELLALPHDAPPVVDHVLEALAEAAELERLSSVERDALAVLAQAHQRVPIIGFVALLVEIEPDERLADLVREPAAEEGVHHRDPE